MLENAMLVVKVIMMMMLLRRLAITCKHVFDVRALKLRELIGIWAEAMYYAG